LDVQTGVDLQNVVGIFDHFSFLFQTNGTKTNTCDGIKMRCVTSVLFIVLWHIHRWQGSRADGLQDVEGSCEYIK
jgi:hypothetical protein